MAVEFSNQSMNPEYDDVRDVPPQEIFDHRGELRIIDVRQPEEFSGELGHIAEAELMPLDTLPNQLSTLQSEHPVVFVCRSGARSARACAFAQAHGLTATFNMKGGMLLWNTLRLPVDGHSTR